ncbi:MAG TPA: C25 family cysteine peptidase [Chitinispirillaceae bacterium]|nr:C25 family cysteine peptidase [Chitinispirillaceae bacterium]
MLLLGGGEAEFSRFNEDAVNQVIRQKMNITRVEADSGSRFYKDGITASKIIVDKINAGVFLINFNGHGGGNIWSDNNFFGYKDLSRLYNGQWGNSGRLPLVLSFTCLTGFFESVSYRSLGEEFLRTSQHGCIGFYGASAYTSQKGNLIMNQLMLETALNGQSETVGEIIDFCEMSMLVRYGSQYLPLIRQYNLLGDPALPWKLTPDTIDMSLDAVSLSDRDSLKLHCKTAPVINGNLKIEINDGTQQWYQSIDTIAKGIFSAKYPIKKSIPTIAGTIRAYAWNDSSEVRGWLNFSKDSILVYDVKLSTEHPFFGDSVFVSCKLSLDSSQMPADVYCRFALGAQTRDDQSFSGVRMISSDNYQWVTTQKIPFTFNNKVSEKLLIYFRILTPLKSRESELFSFNINGRPDLVFTNDSISIQWINDSMRINASALNAGNATSPPFQLHLFWNTEGQIDDTITALFISDSLAPGKTRSFSFAIPDTQGKLFFSGWLNYHSRITELNNQNNRVNGSACIDFKDLSTPKDTLKTNCNALTVIAAQTKKQKQRTFIFTGSLNESAPLKNGSQWAPSVCNNQLSMYHLYSRPQLGITDTLIWTFLTDTSGKINISSNKYAVMIYDTIIKSWKCNGGNMIPARTIQLKSVAAGPMALALINDKQPPEIQVSVAGRVLNFTDYAAKDKPFSILISDPSGIDPQSVNVLFNGKTLAADRMSSVKESGDLDNLTITVYPLVEHKIDSLQITATDLAGNTAKKTVTYKAGEELTIKFLACHPNPFTAQRMSNGLIRNVRFAFLLTDIANSVSLNIYTISGKPVQSWSLSSLIGYQEIKWDGRDRDGARIANGTYYAKLVAKNNQKKVTKIIRIAKLEGF